jgi:hypothetical protein
MNTRSILAALIFLLALAVSSIFSPAKAVIIEISYPDQNIVRAALSDIEAVDDRVYTVRFDEVGTAEILFGDGVQGSRPSSEGGVVASYRFGAGTDGKIINEYEITETKLPFIPIEDFWPNGNTLPNASIVIVGLTSIKFDFSPEGLRVTEADLALAPVPIPTAFWLFGTALIGVIGLSKRRLAL